MSEKMETSNGPWSSGSCRPLRFLIYSYSRIKDLIYARRRVDWLINVNIETLDDLKKVLRENGYSNRAVAQIAKWYGSNHSPA